MYREIEKLNDLNLLAKEVANDFLGGRLLILLDGPMGAGKTQFTRFLLEALGCDDVTSPSFAIHNHYDTDKASVEHVDLYRIDNSDDLESTGFWDLLTEADGIVIVEWSDRLKDWGLFNQLPRNWPLLKLRFEIPPAGANPTGEKRTLLVQKQAGR